MAYRYANGGSITLCKCRNFIDRFGRFALEEVVPDTVAQFVRVHSVLFASRFRADQKYRQPTMESDFSSSSGAGSGF